MATLAQSVPALQRPYCFWEFLKQEQAYSVDGIRVGLRKAGRAAMSQQISIHQPDGGQSASSLSLAPVAVI
jgi:hypothetical protein